MAAGDTLRRITAQDQVILDSSGNMVGLKNPNASGADLRFDPYYANPGPAFDAYGDSITQGAGASTGASNYVSVLASARGLTATNKGVSSLQVGDCADYVIPKLVGTGQQSTLLIGTNDWRVYGNDANKQAVFAAGHMALAAWLAMPEANKIKSTNAAMTYSGAWSLIGVWGALHRSSTVNDTATATIYGTTAYLFYIVQDGAASTFSVTIDGVNQGTFSMQAGGGALIFTQNARNYVPQLLRFPGLSEGPHTVVVKTVSVGGTAPYVYVYAMAGNLGNATKDGPNVYVGNLPRATTAYYGAQFGGAINDTTVAAFNQIVRNNVNLLASDGLNVALAEVAAVVTPTAGLSADGLHPNDAGHAALAGAFQEAMNGMQKPRSQAAVRMPSKAVPVAVTPGASPYKYQNLTVIPQQVVVSGGTVSAIALSRDGTTMFATGQTAGVFVLNPNDYLQVTYTVAPTMTAFPL